MPHALAFDQESVRHKDRDGRLHVAVSPISKAAVNEYLGSEIPDPERKFNLDPKKMYRLLRHPEELAKGAATFNGVPILIKHLPTSAGKHPSDETVGATGTDASFEHPYLTNSLHFWPQAGIDAIETNQQKQLSAGYHYRADMTPGEWDGEPYDGVMRDIVGNHVALVREGRAGEDVLVGDSGEKIAMAKHFAALTARANTIGAICAYLTPIMAMDAKTKRPVGRYDLGTLLAPVPVGKIGEHKKAITDGLAKQLEGKMANDASLDAVSGLLDRLDGVEKEAKPDKGDESVSKEQHNAMAAAANGESELGIPKAVGEEFEDADAGKTFDGDSELREFLTGKGMSPEDVEAACALIGGAGDEDAGAYDDEAPEGETDEEKKKRLAAAGGDRRPAARDRRRGANDEPPPFRGKPLVGGGKAGDRRPGARDRRPGGARDNFPDKDKDKDMITKPAMDAAIAAAVKANTKTQTDLRAAERDVRSWIGEIAPTMAFDSAAGVYEHALKALKVDVTDVDPSAFKAILHAQPKPKRATRLETLMATDAKPEGAKSFEERFPAASRIVVLG